jgi:hypothetical protein
MPSPYPFLRLSDAFGADYILSSDVRNFVLEAIATPTDAAHPNLTRARLIDSDLI